MSTLSKTWLPAWFAHPNLKFTADYLKGDMKIVDAIMERYRDGKIPIDKFELSEYSPDSHKVYPLIDKWLDIALQNGVKYLVFSSFRLYPWPIFKILAAKSLTELVLSNCDMIHASLSSGVVNCHSLRKLSLSSVGLDENMLQTLLNSCPLIVSLILKDCYWLKKIELLNLQKIKSLLIEKGYKSQRVKIQAPTLEHLSYSGYLSEESDVFECQNLKSLELSHVYISNGFLQHLISRSQFLESLMLVKMSSHGSEKLNIYRSQSLKILKIWDCMGIKEIDSSNLVSLEYIEDQIPKLKIARESSQLKHSEIVLKCDNNLLNVAWFGKLRKFLSNLTSWSQVCIDFPRCNEINMKDLQLDHKGSIPQVDVLDVKSLWQHKECPTFVDALLWSCQPRRLNLESTSAMFTCFINRLIYMKNLSDAPSHETEPWHRQLKEAKVHKFDKKSQSWHPVELKRGELSIRTVSEWEKYYFLLDW